METNIQELKEKKRTISLSLSEQIAKKIEKHILVRKSILKEIDVSKHKWALEAIKEKLEKEKDIRSCLTRNKSFNFELPDHLEEKIDERVDFVKKFSKSYSRKKWLVEAFLEKIDNEDGGIKTQLDQSFDFLRTLKGK